MLQISSLICSLIALILGSNSVKGLGVTKIGNEIQFGAHCCETEVKTCFQRQLFTKYMRLTLVFM